MTKKTNSIDLANLKMSVLVAMVNALGGNATMKTFSQRSKAIDRLSKLATEQGVKLEEKFDLDGNELPPEPPAEEPKEEEKAKPAKTKKEKKEPAEPKPKRVSIRSVAEALILEVTGLDENKRKVGHSYETILTKIKDQYPDAKTSVACLRWYAVHMRERGEMPPSRPRAVPAKAQSEASESKDEA